MTSTDIDILVQQGEGATLEFKEAPLRRIEFIEKAGTGIRRIRDEAREVHCPEPEFEVGGFVTVTFRPNPAVRAAAGEVTGEAAGEVTGEVTPQVTPQVRLLRVISGEMTGRQLRDLLDLKDNRHFRGNYLLPALHDGHVEMTIPDRPRSSRQRYRLTPAGREHLKRIGKAR